jgi:hypothetical protein
VAKVAPNGNAFDAFRDSIADVVQLEIDEHFLAAFGQLRHQRKAPA